MGRDTNISWTKSTMNLAWGCSKVSEGCKNCYMFRLSAKFGRKPDEVAILAKTRDEVARRIAGLNSPVFVNSMSDTFHKDIPDHILDEWFIAMTLADRWVFQILTKRPERMAEYFAHHLAAPNLWVGTSVENSRHVDRIDQVRLVKGAGVKFVSFGPLIGDPGEVNLAGIDWVLIEGESDYAEPRPMDPAWAESLVRQAHAQGVRVWFKQMGGKGGDLAGGELLNGRRIQEWPKGHAF